jgi:DNA-binding transcriptional ArsR family regulator
MPGKDSPTQGRGRPSKLSPKQWDAVCHRLLHGERTSDIARALGMAKSTISERLSVRVRTLKLLAIELVRAEFSEQIKDDSPEDQQWLTAMNENVLAWACAEMRRRHGRRQGRHAEP